MRNNFYDFEYSSYTTLVCSVRDCQQSVRQRVRVSKYRRFVFENKKTITVGGKKVGRTKTDSSLILTRRICTIRLVDSGASTYSGLEQARGSDN